MWCQLMCSFGVCHLFPCCVIYICVCVCILQNAKSGPGGVHQASWCRSTSPPWGSTSTPLSWSWLWVVCCVNMHEVVLSFQHLVRSPATDRVSERDVTDRQTADIPEVWLHNIWCNSRSSVRGKKTEKTSECGKWTSLTIWPATFIVHYVPFTPQQTPTTTTTITHRGTH